MEVIYSKEASGITRKLHRNDKGAQSVFFLAMEQEASG